MLRIKTLKYTEVILSSFSRIIIINHFISHLLDFFNDIHTFTMKTAGLAYVHLKLFIVRWLQWKE